MQGLAALKILGAVTVLSYAAARIAVRAGWIGWHRQHVVAVPRSALPPMPRGFAVRALEPGELAGHVIDVAGDVQAARFGRGLTCLGLFSSRDGLAGVVWLGRGQAREGDIALDFVLPATAAWDTGMWIHPDHRIGRAFAALWAGIGEWMDLHGLTHSYSAIADYNLASLSAHRRLGMADIATLLVIRIGRWQWIARGSERWRLVRPSRLLNWRLPDVAAA